MRQHLYEHSTGVLFHILYEPRTRHDELKFYDIRLADTSNYEPTGPDLKHFLHEAAKPTIGAIAQEINDGH